ncbi:hypothetical protein ABZX12_36435 [Kribbella sp. NPDC003505]|uniref:hypothetical protein n=1 Tax=Kribbella sp. NPDC003505 TaxID=3154448 RepID=UPI00339DE8B2
MRRGHAENLVGELYDELVYVAYQATPVRLGRHRRVLVAHAVVQRLPRRRERSVAQLPAELFSLVVKAALSAGESRQRVRIRGLRFFPMTDAPEPLQLEETLHRVPPEVRVAWALRQRAGFDDDAVRRILGAAGVADTTAVLSAAGHIALPPDQLFDPCAVKLAPEWNRSRSRLVPALPLVLIATCLAAWAVLHDPADVATSRATGSSVQSQTVAAGFKAAPANLWRRTSKLDFGAWSPRGELARDAQVQSRVWQFWQQGKQVTTATGTSPLAPAEPPALLYAGRVAGAVVVVVYDGTRIGRYTESGGARSLRLDRVDSADLMTSAAIAVSRTPQGTRYVLAPWIAAAAVRDLAAPAGVSRPLEVDAGLTAAVPGGSAGCRSRFVLELRSSPAVAEKHAFVLADLGDLIPAHLTYMPLPGDGTARSPREVLSAEARSSWALHACSLDGWHDAGTRLINNWAFAEQQLPTGGTARWSCLRVDAWSGQGLATVRLEPPSGPAVPVGTAAGTSACSRFSQNIAAATVWRAPTRQSYVLAAGSRHVTGLVLRTNRGRRVITTPVAAPLVPGTIVTGLQARLANGKTFEGLTGPAGGRSGAGSR